MRLGLYGLPAAGKTYILDRINGIKVLHGSEMLFDIDKDFYHMDEKCKKAVRKELANTLIKEDNFIMDGHYSFGDNVVFTKEDGKLYDAFLYLYIEPRVLKSRMEKSSKNIKYLKFDIEKWQNTEIEKLREYCHEHDKDFYVIDNQDLGYFDDIDTVLKFIYAVSDGFSCVNFAKEAANDILSMSDFTDITLTDGDRTLIREDSSSLIGYKTHIFDGNFYTGFQSFLHHENMMKYTNASKKLPIPECTYNEFVLKYMDNGFILTSGQPDIWENISEKIKRPVFFGNQMSADTKFFITKFLQKNKKVRAFGDSMNDYFMLKRADEAFLIAKPTGELSSSLKNRDLEGIHIV